MIFSKACEYGIRAVLYIAHKSLKEERITLKEIAVEIDSPVAFTAKILQQLSRENLIVSTKGPLGGFRFEVEKMKQTKLMRIVEIIDGEKVFTQCGLGLKVCSEAHPCPVHSEYKHVRQGLIHMLETTFIYDLALELDEKQTYLKH